MQWQMREAQDQMRKAMVMMERAMKDVNEYREGKKAANWLSSSTLQSSGSQDIDVIMTNGTRLSHPLSESTLAAHIPSPIALVGPLSTITKSPATLPAPLPVVLKSSADVIEPSSVTAEPDTAIVAPIVQPSSAIITNPSPDPDPEIERALQLLASRFGKGVDEIRTQVVGQPGP